MVTNLLERLAVEWARGRAQIREDLPQEVQQLSFDNELEDTRAM